MTRRGTSNSNARGSTRDRLRRRRWLLETFAANRQVKVPVVEGENVFALVPACRCYRCGKLLTIDTVTVDRVVPGCRGGTYKRDNIRPSCAKCASITGGHLAADQRRRARSKSL